MKKLFSAISLFFSKLQGSGAYVCDVTPNRADCRYRSGETFSVKALLTKAGVPVTEGKLRCFVKWEGQVVETRDFDLAALAGIPAEVSFTGTKPGWALFSFFVIGKNGKTVPKPARSVLQFTKPDVVIEIGALFDAEKITTQIPFPSDFESYWRGLAAEIQAAPMAPELQEIPSGVEGVKLYAYNIPGDCGVSATGYLALPENAGTKSLPLVISFQSLTSSDAPPEGAVSAAQSGALGLAPTWHGFPVRQPEEFYVTERKRVYPRMQGTDERGKWSFHSVYLRVLRTLAFGKSRPEWNGRDLIVRGGSLGGMQSMVAAALDQDVTLAVVQVPAHCEFNAMVSGRKNAGPFQTGELWNGNVNRELSPAEAAAMAYYDMTNFARFIRCECFFATGFVDELCPPSNVLAACNNLPEGVKKNLFTNPMSGHYNTTRDVQGEERLQKFFDGIKVQRYTAE